MTTEAKGTIDVAYLSLQKELEKEKAHFAEQWRDEETRFLQMLRRAELAEDRVTELEKAITDWETEPSYRVTYLNYLHRIARDILSRSKAEK